MTLREFLFYEKMTLVDMAKELMISRVHLNKVSVGTAKASSRLARDIEKYTNGKVTAEEVNIPWWEKNTSKKSE